MTMAKKNDSKWYNEMPWKKYNVVASLTGDEGDAFTVKLMFMKDDGTKSPSITICFEDIAELESLSEYIIGLARELKSDRSGV